LKTGGGSLGGSGLKIFERPFQSFKKCVFIKKIGITFFSHLHKNLCLSILFYTQICLFSIWNFSHSFRLFLYRVFKSTTAQRHSRHSTDTVPEFHAEAPQATVSEGLAQGPYVAARARVELMALQTKGVDSANALAQSCHISLHSTI